MFTKLSKSEYKKKLKKAIFESINFRWKKLKLNPKANVPNCQLCAFNNELNLFKALNCTTCPGNKDPECCGGYITWYYNPTLENAQVIIDYLESIDVDSWTEHLAELGIFK